MAVKSTKVPELITDGVKEITRVADDAISGVTNAVPQVLYGPAPRTDEMDLDEEIKGELIEFQEDLDILHRNHNIRRCLNLCLRSLFQSVLVHLHIFDR